MKCVLPHEEVTVNEVSDPKAGVVILLRACFFDSVSQSHRMLTNKRSMCSVLNNDSPCFAKVSVFPRNGLPVGIIGGFILVFRILTFRGIRHLSQLYHRKSPVIKRNLNDNRREESYDTSALFVSVCISVTFQVQVLLLFCYTIGLKRGKIGYIRERDYLSYASSQL